MSLFLCPIQDLCQHFITGDNKPPNHNVRIKHPCFKWVSMECPIIDTLATVQEFATGELMACNIQKIKRLKE